MTPTWSERRDVGATVPTVEVPPTRPRKPRDKAKVESAVQVVQRWIVMRLRHRRLFSIQEAKESIRELLDRLNQRPFRKRHEESRASLFQDQDAE